MLPNEPVLETQVVFPAPVTQPPPPIAQSFTVGGVLAKTAQVWWKHLPAFTAMTAVVYAPIASVGGAFFVAMAGVGSAPPQENIAAKLGAAVLAVGALTIVLATIQTGAVSYATLRHLSGERARFAEMVRAGFRRVLPLIGLGLLLWLAIVLGMLLFLVPGVFVMVATCAAIPASVAERPGVIGAIRRSLALTRGYRWALFGAGLATLVGVWVLQAVVQVGATVVSTALFRGEQAVIGMVALSQIGNVFFSAIPIIGLSVAYHDLRVAKEGVDTSALARVFE